MRRMHGKPRAAGPPTLASVVWLIALLAGGCRPDPSLPPDPEDPTPALGCDQIPLTLTRVEADSELDRPSWLQVCSACPIAEGTIAVEDGAGATVRTEVVWSPGRECIVALPFEPLPARPAVPVRASVVDPEGRTGAYDFDLPLPTGRGADPVDLGTATWHLPLPSEAWRLLDGADVLPDAPRGLLLSLGVADGDAARVVSVGVARGDSQLQDTCQATTSFSTPATLLSRQVATPLVFGDELPGGIVLERGALQARLTDDGSALLDVTLLALVSLPDSEGAIGMTPAEYCAARTGELGVDPCVPCGPPSDGLAGLPACVPLLIEGARAERVDRPLLALDPLSIRPDCRQAPPSAR